MLKKQRYEVPISDALEISIENDILFASNEDAFNGDNNELPIDGGVLVF